MNNKLFLIGLMMVPCLLLAQSQDIKLGKINFPQAYVHAGKEFPEGRYDIVLTMKDAVPFFNVYDSKQELLFEELAIIKPYAGRKMSAPYRLKKDFLKGQEYFRIKVIKPEQWLLAYFLVKK